MNAGTAYLSVAAGFFVATAIKLWALRKNPRDPLLRAVTATLFVAAFLFVTAAPPNLAVINEMLGIPNIAAPIVYSILTAFDGISIVLLIHWRGNEDARVTLRQTRLCLTTYATVMVAICVLFALGDAPVERLRDLDTYYSSTPWIREMILLYLTAHTVAAVTLVLLCLRWSRKVPGTLKAGLLLITAGAVIMFGYDLLKFTAIFARWLGHDWDSLSTDVAFSLAGFSAFLFSAGFMLPPIGQGVGSRWRALRRFRRLQPLWLEIRPEIPPTSPPPMPWWQPVKRRLMQRETDIFDAVLRLTPWFDQSTGTEIYALALAEYSEARRARGEADACVIARAVIRKGYAVPALAPERRWTVSSIEDSEDLVDMSAAMLCSRRVEVTRRSSALAEHRA
ncbi:MAB_1171c family putative transporter [Streptomyces sp. NPDC006487]|uniref:MAB_1171c family putative transporter n=1 Tax=Streptomyces sp. NPDC006487 TaxID=3364748 RepID=UPI0036B68EAD